MQKEARAKDDDEVVNPNKKHFKATSSVRLQGKVVHNRGGKCLVTHKKHLHKSPKIHYLDDMTNIVERDAPKIKPSRTTILNMGPDNKAK